MIGYCAGSGLCHRWLPAGCAPTMPPALTFCYRRRLPSRTFTVGRGLSSFLQNLYTIISSTEPSVAWSVDGTSFFIKVGRGDKTTTR